MLKPIAKYLVVFQMNGNAWGCPVGPAVTGQFNTPLVNISTILYFLQYFFICFFFLLKLLFRFWQYTTGGGFQYLAGAETGFKLMPATQPVSVHKFSIFYVWNNNF